MAQKRMFSKKITDSGEFLKMPLSAQCLYFHLNLHADDDGVIDNAKTIMRMIGANDDDINILLAKKYLLVVEGEIVVIRHWWIHNTILKDRYDESLYKSQLETTFSIDRNKQYTFNDNKMLTKSYQNDNKNDNKKITNSYQNVNPIESSIDKSSIDKSSVIFRDNQNLKKDNTKVLQDLHTEEDKVTTTLLKYIPSAGSIWLEKIQKLRDRHMSDELLIKAIESTAEANTRDCRYFMAICEEYIAKGYQNAAEVDEAQKKYKKNKNLGPSEKRDVYNEWFKKNILKDKEKW